MMSGQNLKCGNCGELRGTAGKTAGNCGELRGTAGNCGELRGNCGELRATPCFGQARRMGLILAKWGVLIATSLIQACFPRFFFFLKKPFSGKTAKNAANSENWASMTLLPLWGG